jgi:hypothetical protein
MGRGVIPLQTLVSFIGDDRFKRLLYHRQMEKHIMREKKRSFLCLKKYMMILIYYSKTRKI